MGNEAKITKERFADRIQYIEPINMKKNGAPGVLILVKDCGSQPRDFTIVLPVAYVDLVVTLLQEASARAKLITQDPKSAPEPPSINE